MIGFPFCEPPAPEARAASRLAPAPASFRGRAGVLVLRRGADCLYRFAFEPLEGTPGRWEEIDGSRLWPERTEPAMPHVLLTNGRGEKADLVQLCRRFLGTRAQPLSSRHADQWREAFCRALSSPTVQLLLERNRSFQDWEPEASAEWFIGTPSPQEIRWPGAFYPPARTTAPLVRFLLEGCRAGSERPLCPEPMELPVLYEDQDLVVVNKPSGLPSVPGTREVWSAKGLLEKRFGSLFAVHRLDMETSGILLFARNLEAASALGRAFREHRVCKRYRALLEGVPAQSRGTVALPLAADAMDLPRHIVLPPATGGKEAATRFETASVLECADRRVRALVDLFPKTGRTHQLRIHCAHPAGLGCPIEGDSIYGSQGALLLRSGRPLCLHMAEIEFEHPADGRRLHFESEPGYLSLFLKRPAA
ncbi:RluA family pseudouridine synthase [Mesosutterella sp. OilRF-GAM-744-9]|uniref:RluA family pseudouridine synthase n=1 Tax=Mesosutterella porci TaxID=2915351 RepID=A0ABS9MMZ7_9BURK|nr:RluA family pseudouridine synthase [Mesosutterella sp. oilRF-744-WT-GAM-9]MCG5029996.1 RluA family pseudouridine synthase [Mesosutterella sp. oilRF-744-WT-GAM-9]